MAFSNALLNALQRCNIRLDNFIIWTAQDDITHNDAQRTDARPPILVRTIVCKQPSTVENVPPETRTNVNLSNPIKTVERRHETSRKKRPNPKLTIATSLFKLTAKVSQWDNFPHMGYYPICLRQCVLCLILC